MATFTHNTYMYTLFGRRSNFRTDKSWKKKFLFTSQNYTIWWSIGKHTRDWKSSAYRPKRRWHIVHKSARIDGASAHKSRCFGLITTKEDERPSCFSGFARPAYTRWLCNGDITTKANFSCRRDTRRLFRRVVWGGYIALTNYGAVVSCRRAK